MYLDEVACVKAITLNLEYEAADWVMYLHDKGTPELGNVDAFLEELRARFGDPVRARQAEFRIRAKRQGRRYLVHTLFNFTFFILIHSPICLWTYIKFYWFLLCCENE